jgi:hypothetical protein
VPANFPVLKRESDLLRLTSEAPVAGAPDAIFTAQRLVKERPFSPFGWVSLFVAGTTIVAVTWFVIHLPG